MRCPSCDHDSRPERRFCADCGAALAALCAACGASNEPGEKFCGRCGEWLQTAALPPAVPQRAPAPAAAPPQLAPAVATAARPPPATLPPAPPRPRHRLAAVDWLLIGTLLPLCVFGFVMSVVRGVHGDFVVAPFSVSSAADEQSYPIVERLLSSLTLKPLCEPLEPHPLARHAERLGLRAAGGDEIPGARRIARRGGAFDGVTIALPGAAALHAHRRSRSPR
jgi:hypothetical protein